MIKNLNENIKIAPSDIIGFTDLDVNGQCKAFAKRTCLPELGFYTHDGNYHATVLSEGEEAELYKTFLFRYGIPPVGMRR